jgi:AcrR family transcriptional regulator
LTRPQFGVKTKGEYCFRSREPRAANGDDIRLWGQQSKGQILTEEETSGTLPTAHDNVHELRPGRREAKKRDKLGRIRTAARAVFIEKGFAEANMREIAVAAHVGFGTLFLYAKDKQDLLLLLFDEELSAIALQGFQKAAQKGDLIDQLLVFFEELYLFYMETPQLSRDMLRELTFTDGIVSKRIHSNLKDVEGNLARLVAQAQANGKVNSGIAPDHIAHIMFSLYRIEVRLCFDEEPPEIGRSLQELRRQFQTVYQGFSARSGAEVEAWPMPLASGGPGGPTKRVETERPLRASAPDRGSKKITPSVTRM